MRATSIVGAGENSVLQYIENDKEEINNQLVLMHFKSRVFGYTPCFELFLPTEHSVYKLCIKLFTTHVSGHKWFSGGKYF